MLCVAFRKEFANDLTDPGRAFGLFTFVAATDVLGTRLAIATSLGGHRRIGKPDSAGRLHPKSLTLPRLRGASRRYN